MLATYADASFKRHPMLRATEYDVLLKDAVEDLKALFPTLHPAELAHAVARANLKVLSEGRLRSVSGVERIEHARAVTKIARKDLEHITGRRTA